MRTNESFKRLEHTQVLCNETKIKQRSISMHYTHPMNSIILFPKATFLILKEEKASVAISSKEANNESFKRLEHTQVLCNETKIKQRHISIHSLHLPNELNNPISEGNVPEIKGEEKSSDAISSKEANKWVIQTIGTHTSTLQRDKDKTKTHLHPFITLTQWTQ